MEILNFPAQLETIMIWTIRVVSWECEGRLYTEVLFTKLCFHFCQLMSQLLSLLGSHADRKHTDGTHILWGLLLLTGSKSITHPGRTAETIVKHDSRNCPSLWGKESLQEEVVLHSKSPEPASEIKPG